MMAYVPAAAVAMTCPAGSLLPVAYASVFSDQNTPIMDLLVVAEDGIPYNASLGFRFYPSGQGYQAPTAVCVTFILNASLGPGDAVRLAYNPGGPVAPGMQLFVHRAGAAVGTWTLLSDNSLPVGPIATASTCFVYTAPRCATVEGIAAVGFGDLGTDVIPPPACVLPCKYVVAIHSPTEPAQYAYYAGGETPDTVTARLLSPGAWRAAWQLLKWPSPPWTTLTEAVGAWRYSTDITTYAANVNPAADVLISVGLLPGQLVPIAVKPYDAIGAPAFGGVLVVVATCVIPACTKVRILGNNWSPSVTAESAWWVWNSGTLPLQPGTVVKFWDLGPSSTFPIPRTTHGSISATVSLPSSLQPVTAFTLYSAADVGIGDTDSPAAEPAYITGLYPCSYAGAVPPCLVAGASMAASPWPDGPAILPVGECAGANGVGSNPVVSWPVMVRRLFGMCPVRWFCQLLPTFPTLEPPCGPPKRCCTPKTGCARWCGALPGTLPL